MSQSTTSLDAHFSPHASLAALVAHLKAHGILSFDAHGRLFRITLSSASSLTKLMLVPLRQLLAPSSINVILDKT